MFVTLKNNTWKKAWQSIYWVCIKCNKRAMSINLSHTSLTRKVCGLDLKWLWNRPQAQSRSQQDICEDKHSLPTESPIDLHSSHSMHFLASHCAFSPWWQLSIAVWTRNIPTKSKEKLEGQGLKHCLKTHSATSFLEIQDSSITPFQPQEGRTAS